MVAIKSYSTLRCRLVAHLLPAAGTELLLWSEHGFPLKILPLYEKQENNSTNVSKSPKYAYWICNLILFFFFIFIFCFKTQITMLSVAFPQQTE